MRRDAFTLIELLVVISIMTLLLALLLPTLGSARSTARDVQCKSQLRQWQIAWLAYSVDVGETVGSWQTGANPPGGGYYPPGEHWYVPLRDWVSGNESLIIGCPSVGDPPDDGSGYGGRADRNWYPGPNHKGLRPDHLGGYGYNLHFEESIHTTSYGRQLLSRVDMVRSPSTTPVFGDAAWADIGWITETDGMPGDLRDPGLSFGIGYMRRLAMTRHGNGAMKQDATRAGVNLVMADGSARLVVVDALWSVTWRNGFQTRESYDDPLP